MIRIKKEYIGRVIIKGSNKYELTEDMTQKQILFIKNMVSPHFIEDDIIDVGDEYRNVEVDKVIKDEPIKKSRKKQ
jgi:hypothetical protein